MRKTAIVCLLFSLVLAARSVVALDSPTLILQRQGGGALLTHDPHRFLNAGMTGTVQANALWRIAEERNPGVRDQFFLDFANRMIAEGFGAQRADGTMDWGSNYNYSRVSHLWEAQIWTSLVPYLNTVKATRTQREVETAAWARLDSPVGTEGVPPLLAAWYTPSETEGAGDCLDEYCSLCDGEQQWWDWVQCGVPGWCIVDCAGPCDSCSKGGTGSGGGGGGGDGTFVPPQDLRCLVGNCQNNALD